MARSRSVVVLLALALTASAAGGPDGRVLIVTDERPQMVVLARYLRDAGGLESAIVDQSSSPDDWSVFDAVVGYVHFELTPVTERRIIDYTRGGGRFLCLHHSISSGKIKNEHYFDFLGVALEGAEHSREPAEPGGHYAWREGVALKVVNLNPDHYITRTGVSWPEMTAYRPSDEPSVGREFEALTLDPSEAYMNVAFTDGREKTVLLGFKFQDDRNGRLFMQDREGWLKRSGKGWIVYLQMGHFAEEWRNPAVAQMALNAIRWRPEAEAD
jgi:Trehalose utilisation